MVIANRGYFLYDLFVQRYSRQVQNQPDQRCQGTDK